MNKKLFYLFFILIFGGFIMFQSCQDYPIDPDTELPGLLNLIPNKFYGVGNEFPQRCDPVSVNRLELWAGVGNNNAGTHVGFVEFTSLSGNIINVKYSLLYPWAVTEIHFQMSDKLSGIPVNKSGNPVPGQFDYKHTFSEPYTENSFEFQYTKPVDTDGNSYYVAAHAGVCKYEGVQNLNLSLPDGIVSGINVEHNYPYYYFNFNFLNSSAGFLQYFDLDGPGPMLPGNFHGYCIDADNHIYPTTEICGKLYSSYETLPANIIGEGKFEYPENLPLLNWIINNFDNGSYIAKYSYDVPLSGAKWPFTGNFTPSGGHGTLTMGDIQCAIWSITDNNTASSVWSDVGVWSPSNPKGYTAENVWGIIHAALTTPGASAFVPGCDQKMVVMLVPVNCETGVWNGTQFMMFYIPVPCGTGCETAWGDGKFGARFPNANQWGTYIRWNVTCPTP